MEGLKLRAIVVCALLGAVGVAIALYKPPTSQTKDELWIAEHSPTQINGFTMQQSAESPLYSYKMNESTYNVLEPYGIVARVFDDDVSDQQYDVVLVGSRSKESFHDPRVCFSAQGWSLSNQWVDKVETKTRGTVYFTITVMDGVSSRDQIAAYVYNGPGCFFANTQRLKGALLWETLIGGRQLDGAFYRFIPLVRRSDQIQQINDLRNFIGLYLDEANRTSDGFF